MVNSENSINGLIGRWDEPSKIGEEGLAVTGNFQSLDGWTNRGQKSIEGEFLKELHV